MLERLLAKRHVRHLDLASVRAELVEKRGWTSERAEEVEIGYKRFLYALARKDQGDILSPPTQEVDEFWHQHILDTRKYREDCDRVFGHYMDHTPGLTPEQQLRADERRRTVYSDHGIDFMDFDSGDGSSGHETGAGHTHGDGADCHDGHGSDCDAGSGHGGGESADGGGGDGGGGDGGGGGCGGGGCGGE